ncbi:MAG TPA: DMT family transporter [Polyangiaceae bacterium]|nr:DMT family transporter [Polyangiaceae bacterium]
MRAAFWLFLGVFACATAVILIKRSTLEPALLSSLRLLFASVLLAPLFLRERTRYRDRWRLRDARRSVLPALALAAHFITWVIGARATLAANASLIVNMVPLVMPLFLALVVGERIRRAELAGTALGFSGVVVLSASDFGTGGAHLSGDLTCFGSMLFFALYLTLGRYNRDLPSIWLYVAPLYAVAGSACLLVALMRSGVSVFRALDAREASLVAALAVIPTIIGHSLLNLSLRRLPGATVSVCNLAQFLFAGALAWALFGEFPKPAFWPASLLIISGAAVSLLTRPSSTPSQPEAEAP